MNERYDTEGWDQEARGMRGFARTPLGRGLIRALILLMLLYTGPWLELLRANPFNGAGLAWELERLVGTALELVVPAAQAQGGICDLDADADVDRADIGAIMARRNQPAQGAGDPADADGNGWIDADDARQCVLQCTLARCAEPSANNPPTADAGADRETVVGATVDLDGSASSDPDGDPLRYGWRFTALPADSTAALTGADTAAPSFTVDAAGEYRIELVVNDGAVDSAPDTVSVVTVNRPPTADAGADQSAAVGTVVTLDGSASSDPDGDALSYLWRLSGLPDDSGAALDDPTAVAPSFRIDLPGDYTAELIVNDGLLDSAPDQSVVSTVNSAPVADAGPPQSALVGATVTLDGTASSDVDGDPLTYRWRFDSRPAGSAAALDDPSSAMPRFAIDAFGDYVIELIVNDGALDSAPDTTTVSTDNSAPVADAGPPQSGFIGDTVTLDGRGSFDPDGDALGYSWSFTARPSGSAAAFDDAASATPSFPIDVFGDYTARLVVDDGLLDSAPDTTTVSTDNSRPVADAGESQTVPAGDTVDLDGTGSSDADGHALTYQWSITTRPDGSSATLSDPTAAQPSFLADRPGLYVVQLIVNDGFENSDPSTVSIQAQAIVPDVVGLAQAEGEADVLAASLAVGTITQQNSDTVPAGDVISQDPAAGTQVAAGSAIDLVVSLGPVLVSVPDVVGQTQATAEAAIADAGLVVGTVTTANSDIVPAGSVISQTPVGGTEVPAGNAVDLVISLGPALVTVPDVVGQTQADAEAAITAANLVVGTVTTTNSDTVGSGDVISQNPAGGITVAEGNAVDLVVSTGPVTSGPDLQPPLLFIESVPVVAGDSASILVRATDNIEVVSVTLTVDGRSVAIGPDELAIVDAAVPGIFLLRGSATDSSGNQTIETGYLHVLGTDDGTPPTAQISAPAVGAELSEAMEVIGTASDGNLARWELTATPISPPNGDDFLLNEGIIPVNNGMLGILDPTVLGAGEHLLRLTVWDTGGRIARAERVVTSANEAKYGLFSLTFTDALIPLPSFPLSVQRTYHSGNRGRQGDFGFGWHLGVRSMKLEVDNEAGADWTRRNIGSFFPNWVLVPQAPHTITVLDNDDNAIIFDFTPSFDDPVFDATFASAAWTERTATGATLTPLDTTSLVYSGGSLLSLNTFDVYDPPGYVLAMPDGRRYTFDVDEGLTAFRDANGNTLAITADGIASSRGVGIDFTRDALGRITEATLPSGATTSYRYDAAGNLVSVTDAEGHETTFAYDRNHYLLGIVDPLHRVPMRSEYDDDGRLVALVDPDGQRIEFVIDPTLRRQTVTDRLRNVTVNSYDADGRLIEVREADGSTRTLTWDTNGNKTSETDGLGRTTEWSYDTRHRVTSRTDALGHTTTYEYDAAGNLTATTDALGRVKTVEYDSDNNPVRETFPDGSVRVLTYDDQGNVLTETDALGGVTVHDYDAQGREIRTVHPAGGVTSFAYDPDGNKIEETNPIGVVRSYAYDNLGNLIGVTDALGEETRNRFDPLGRKIEQTHPLGGVSTKVYDDFGRLTSETDAAGATTTYERDAEGRVVRSTGPDGSVTTQEYDAMGRVIRRAIGSAIEQRFYDAAGQLVRVNDANGGDTVFAYDAAGRLTSRVFPNGVGETFTYDAVGNLLSRTCPLGTTSFTYDAMNRVASRTDPDGQTTSFGYDALGRMLSVVLPDNNGLEYQYDAEGRLTRVEDSLGNISRFEQDASGQRVSFVDPLGRATTYRYDLRGFPAGREVEGVVLERYNSNAMGWITSRTDADGQVTSYDYDQAGRVIRIVYPDGTDSVLTYTSDGKRSSVVDARGATQYSYDGQGRLSSVTHPSGEIVSYGYDVAGRLEALITPAGETRYERDALGRVDTVVDPAGRRYELRRNAAGMLASITYPNGVETTIDYDANGRELERSIVTPTGTLLARFVASRDDVGRLATIDESGDGISGDVVRSYAYDAASRLVRAEVTRDGIAEDSQTYAMDAFGNRIQVSDDGVAINIVYDSLDRIVRAGAEAFTHDDNGRLTRRDGPSGVTTYTYDFEHRLRQVTLPGVSDPIRYDYDIDGNRVSRSQGVDTVRYVLDASSSLPDVLLESDATGRILASYVYVDGVLLSMDRGGVVRYVHSDVSGHVRLVTDATGDATDTFEYDAYGNSTARTGVTSLPYRFAGQRYDEETGLYYLRARYYDPAIGRFLTSDPAPGDPMQPISFNRYLYAIADPVNMIDPSGLQHTASGAMAGVSMASVLSSIAIPSFTGILASVKVQLFVAGVLSVAVAHEIATNPAALRLLEEQWEILKQQIEIWVAAMGAAACGVPVFHYTDQASAILILATQTMIASPKYAGPVFTYPAGVYASTIPPVGPMTQSQLSAWFYGGNQNRDVGWFVGLCSNLNGFSPVFSPTHPDFWYRPAPAGFPVPVVTFTIGPNLMLP
jgi:RHS repeat-associated protein